MVESPEQYDGQNPYWQKVQGIVNRVEEAKKEPFSIVKFFTDLDSVLDIVLWLPPGMDGDKIIFDHNFFGNTILSALNALVNAYVDSYQELKDSNDLVNLINTKFNQWINGHTSVKPKFISSLGVVFRNLHTPDLKERLELEYEHIDFL